LAGPAGGVDEALGFVYVLFPAELIRPGAVLTTAHVSNETLLLRVAAGDRTAFRDLYVATSSQLFGVCVSLLRDRARAEEALQEAFVRVWERAKRYDATKGAALAWMTVVTRRVALNELRRRDNVHSSLNDDERAPHIAADMAESDPIGKGRLLHCLEKLEADRRQWVLLAYVHGYSHEELARRFERPLGTMKSALFRGLADLRKCIS